MLTVISGGRAVMMLLQGRMWIVQYLLAMLVLVLVVSSTAWAQKPLHVEFDRRGIGNGWMLSVYRDSNGPFSHCSVSTVYAPRAVASSKGLRASNVRLNVMADGERLGFGIETDGRNISPGAKYRFDFVFDNGKRGSIAAATGIGADRIEARFKFHSEWLDNFSESKAVRIKVDRRDIGSFNLTGSRHAINELLDCVDRNANASGVDTFGASVGTLIGAPITKAISQGMLVFNGPLGDDWRLETHVDKDRLFSHCLIVKEFKAQNAESRAKMRADIMNLYFTAATDGNIGIGVSANEWSFVSNTDYALHFEFGSGVTWSVVAQNISDADNVIHAAVKYDPALVGMFTEEASFELMVNSINVGRFNLKGSSVSFMKLMECVVENSK